jgi:hypothetical protein
MRRKTAPSNNVTAFLQSVDKILASDTTDMVKREYLFLKDNYLVEHTYNQILKHF